jgi:acyl carrier protein
LIQDSSTIKAAAREVASQLAGRPIKDGQRLISSGLIDSLAILKLISQLEKKLGISIPTENLQPDDFDNLDLIVETVQRVAQPAS